jgi:hypothetical protein
MLRLFYVFVLLLSFAGAPFNGALAYQEAKIDQVMGELKTANPALFKKAEKVYAYATKNANEIIEKPLLTKHNKALNGFVDRNNRVSAKFYASGTEGIAARMVMLFKFSGKKYKVIEDYNRAKKCKKFAACAPWQKLN